MLMAEDGKSLLGQEPLSRHTIAVAGYKSTRSRSLSPPQIATLLRDELVRPEFAKRFSNIVFVTHSLGGIILKSILNRSSLNRDALIQRTRAVFFLGTPSQGSPVLSSAALSFLATLPECTGGLVVNLKEIEQNAYLQEIEGTWHDLYTSRTGLRPFRVYCAYETKPTSKLGVIVPMQHATTDCDERWPIEGDHFSISKPAGVDSDTYRRVREKIVLALAAEPLSKLYPQYFDLTEGPKRDTAEEILEIEQFMNDENESSPNVASKGFVASIVRTSRCPIPQETIQSLHKVFAENTGRLLDLVRAIRIKYLVSAFDDQELIQLRDFLRSTSDDKQVLMQVIHEMKSETTGRVGQPKRAPVSLRSPRRLTTTEQQAVAAFKEDWDRNLSRSNIRLAEALFAGAKGADTPGVLDRQTIKSGMDVVMRPIRDRWATAMVLRVQPDTRNRILAFHNSRIGDKYFDFGLDAENGRLVRAAFDEILSKTQSSVPTDCKTLN
jgi:hypothetical protein